VKLLPSFFFPWKKLKGECTVPWKGILKSFLFSSGGSRSTKKTFGVRFGQEEPGKEELYKFLNNDYITHCVYPF